MHREEKQARSGSEYLQQLQWRQEVCWSVKDRLSGCIGLRLLLPNARRWHWFAWSWAAHLTYRSTSLRQSVHKVYNKILGKSSSICWVSFTKPSVESISNVGFKFNSLADWCGVIEMVFKMASFPLLCEMVAKLSAPSINFYWSLFWRKLIHLHFLISVQFAFRQIRMSFMAKGKNIGGIIMGIL